MQPSRHPFIAIFYRTLITQTKKHYVYNSMDFQEAKTSRNHHPDGEIGQLSLQNLLMPCSIHYSFLPKRTYHVDFYHHRSVLPLYFYQTELYSIHSFMCGFFHSIIAFKRVFHVAVCRGNLFNLSGMQYFILQTSYYLSILLQTSSCFQFLAINMITTMNFIQR